MEQPHDLTLVSPLMHTSHHLTPPHAPPQKKGTYITTRFLSHLISKIAADMDKCS